MRSFNGDEHLLQYTTLIHEPMHTSHIRWPLDLHWMVIERAWSTTRHLLPACTSIYKLEQSIAKIHYMAKMEKNKQLSTMAAVLMLLLVFWLMISPALGCPSDGSECKDCIVNQMRNGCPSCAPVLSCMARCLWGGASKSKCVKRCDCYGGKPRLSDCKKCMSRCKCSCEA